MRHLLLRRFDDFFYKYRFRHLKTLYIRHHYICPSYNAWHETRKALVVEGQNQRVELSVLSLSTG
jgi:hypothetical protein